MTKTPDITPDNVQNRRKQKKKMKENQITVPIQNVASALEELDKLDRGLSVSNEG